MKTQIFTSGFLPWLQESNTYDYTEYTDNHQFVLVSISISITDTT